jgi:hypothetical protein
MNFTHTFEIEVGDIQMEGELSFDNENVVTIKTDESLEVSILLLSKIESTFIAAHECRVLCGELKKFEINLK